MRGKMWKQLIKLTTIALMVSTGDLAIAGKPPSNARFQVVRMESAYTRLPGKVIRVLQNVYRWRIGGRQVGAIRGRVYFPRKRTATTTRVIRRRATDR